MIDRLVLRIPMTSHSGHTMELRKGSVTSCGVVCCGVKVPPGLKRQGHTCTIGSALPK